MKSLKFFVCRWTPTFMIMMLKSFRISFISSGLGRQQWKISLIANRRLNTTKRPTSFINFFFARGSVVCSKSLNFKFLYCLQFTTSPNRQYFLEFLPTYPNLIKSKKIIYTLSNSASNSIRPASAYFRVICHHLLLYPQSSDPLATHSLTVQVQVDFSLLLIQFRFFRSMNNS